MDLGLHEIGMPEEGLFRGGRWADVIKFPPPAPDISSRILTPGPLLVDGYPRWEDAYGRFSTAKFSATKMAAVGRPMAGFRRYVSGGINFLDKMKGYFLAEPDGGEPAVHENRVPPSHFEDAHVLYLDYDPDLRFVDLDHPETVQMIEAIVGTSLTAIGADLGGGISQNRDRRVTRLVMATVYNLCGDYGFDKIVGVRCAAPEPEWDSYVFWNPPPGIDLTEGLVKPVSPYHEAVREAARRLELELP